ncbi:YIP1 family protein [Rhodobacteraceae bacterium XHP0102]|nr:YIP1 family protein [Rhodobacteraceae bacterium XHP0102]
MSVTRDIVASWRSPRAVIRAMLDRGRREDRAIAFVMIACFLLFVAQWPSLSREAFLDPSVPLQARLSITFFSMMMVMPLMLYILAALSHVLAKITRGRGSFYSARLALFWSLLVTSPLFLLYGLVAGFIGQGPAMTAMGVVTLLGFFAIWLSCLFEAERAPEAASEGV